MDWQPFRGDTVVGDVRVLRGAADRDLFAYLPPSHGDGGRFPVVYMLDGQNLFDDATAHSGVEWSVDETMEKLAREGKLSTSGGSIRDLVLGPTESH